MVELLCAVWLKLDPDEKPPPQGSPGIKSTVALFKNAVIGFMLPKHVSILNTGPREDEKTNYKMIEFN